METLARPNAPAAVNEHGEFMSLADAVANCQVKAKKTIVRWAKADGIRERYGRSGASTIERVVPVDWIRGKMLEKDLAAEPIYEPVELIENVSFTKNDNVQPLGSKVPALFSEEAPQLMVFFERLKQSQEAQALQVRTLIHEQRQQADVLGQALQASKEEGKQEIRRFRRFQTWVNLGLVAGVIVLVAGTAFVVRMGFELNASRTEEMRTLKKSLAEKISTQESALREEMQGIKQSSRALRSIEERRAAELAEIRQGIGVLREDLNRREGAMEGLLLTKEKQLAAMRARLEALIEEKEALERRGAVEAGAAEVVPERIAGEAPITVRAVPGETRPLLSE